MTADELLIEELDRRNAELTLLLDLGREVVGALDVGQVLEAGVRTAARSLRCSCAYVLLPNQDGSALRIAAREDPQPPLEADLELPFAQDSLSALAFRTLQAQVSFDTRGDPRIAPEVTARFGCTSTLAVPLLSHGRALGVLTMFERSGRIFEAQDVRLATHAAQLISVALENARLYQDLGKSYAELARTQKELIDRERMAALGELSASIAHEVRNPLGVIFNSVGSLRRLLKPQGDVSLIIDIVGEEAERLNRMVGDLLDYSRPVRPALQPLPLGSLIDEALAAARQQIGPAAEAVKSEVQIAAGAETVRADARLLRQALINLFLNAYQAMPRSGTLEVRASRVEHDGVSLSQIAIHDTGAGIPAEARPKVFQPFFTTKAMGTGLGLAVVKRIVEGHGGTIELASAKAGTEFHLRLPLEA
jgi:signal transduction histidine kinase